MRSRLNFDAIQREINTRLDPDSIAIDGRDLRDRLAFVASIAELIIFYDENNKQAGNWHSLLLKDPVILLAVMSKTDYQAAHLQYAQIQPSLNATKRWIAELPHASNTHNLHKGAATAHSTDGEHSADSEKPVGSEKSHSGENATHDKHSVDSEKATLAIHQLLRLLDSLFSTINQWASYISDSNNSFVLKEYIVQQVPERLSVLLSQRIAIQSYLATKLPQCLPSTPGLSRRDFCDLWTAQANATAQPPSDTVAALLQLEDIYQAVFGFYVQVVTEAKSSFYDLAVQANDFPDTSLIIACNELLKYSQVGLNEFSRKHLDFYFHTLLQQHKRAATADSTFLCVTLAEKTASIHLPAGTAFTAGTYADKSPIIFSSDQETELNQIKIGAIQSSNYLPTHTQASAPHRKVLRQQYVEALPDSTLIHRNQQGQIQASEWFGQQQTQAVQQGFVLASPMFYLASGVRNIVLTFTLSDALTVDDINHAIVSLSTSKGWCEVVATPQASTPTTTVTWEQGKGEKQNQLILAIRLASDFPGVAYFKKPPLGFQNDQCYLRVLLPNSIDLQKSFRIHTLDIAVQASDSESFALSNDAALLVNNKPMAIFGSTADVGNHCFVSSPEAFSKPLHSVDLTLVWDNVSDDLSDYFSAYNQYLDTQGKPANYYHNTAFTIAWATDTEAGWQPISATLSDVTPAPETESDMSDSDSNHKQKQQPAPPTSTPWYKRLWRWVKHEVEDGVEQSQSHAEPTQIANGLFAQTTVQRTKSTTAVINAPQSNFRITLPEDVAFEPQSVAALASNKNPRLRFTLTGPNDTFGNRVYGPLVSAITLENAKTLMSGFGLLGPIVQVARGVAHVLGGLIKTLSFLPIINVIAKKVAAPAQNLGKTQPLPNTPLILKAKQARLQYEASQHIDLTQDIPALTQDFTLLHIGSVSTYTVFAQAVKDEKPTVDLRQVALQPQHIGAVNTHTGCLLFQGVCAPAPSVNVSLQEIKPPCLLNVYVELAQDISSDHTPPNANSAEAQHHAEAQHSVALFFWSTRGWQPMTVLHDGTKALTRSGLLTLNIDASIWLDSAVFTPVTATPPKQPLLQSQLLLTQQGERRVQTVYCNTQGIKVSRTAPIPLPAGEMPTLPALSIKKSAQKLPAISQFIQPFASFGGAPAENNALFNARVSQRLKTKDRASNDQDFVSLVKQADADIFYVKRLTAKRPGHVKLGVVQHYASADSSNALRPVVPRAEQVVIQDFLAKRMSAMTQVSVCNLQHEPLQVCTTLVIDETANANDLIAAVQNGINIYLSPWVSSAQPQYCLAEGLSKANLTRFIASFPQVEAVQKLQLCVENQPVTAGANDADVVCPRSEASIWVAAQPHKITLIRATSITSQQKIEPDTTPAITLPENTLTEARA